MSRRRPGSGSEPHSSCASIDVGWPGLPVRAGGRAQGVATERVTSLTPDGARRDASRLASNGGETTTGCTRSENAADLTSNSVGDATTCQHDTCDTALQRDVEKREAEREGFEPSVPVKVHRFSRPAHSATLSPLRCRSVRTDTKSISACEVFGCETNSCHRWIPRQNRFIRAGDDELALLVGHDRSCCVRMFRGGAGPPAD